MTKYFLLYYYMYYVKFAVIDIHVMLFCKIILSTTLIKMHHKFTEKECLNAYSYKTTFPEIIICCKVNKLET